MSAPEDLSSHEREAEHQRRVQLFEQQQPDIESLITYLPVEECWNRVHQAEMKESAQKDLSAHEREAEQPDIKSLITCLPEEEFWNQVRQGVQAEMKESESYEPIETKMSFSVLTYNILHPDWAKPDRYPNVPSSILEWSYRLPLIIAKLRESKADIICLQEVDASSFHADLYAPMAESGYSGFWQQNKSRLKALLKWNGEAKSKPNTMVCATFIRNDKFQYVGQVSGSRHLTLSLRTLDSPQLLTITNVHLESIQVPDALQLHATHIRNLGKEVDLVCGDFNEDIDDPVTEVLKQEFESAYQVSQPIKTFQSMARTQVLDQFWSRATRLRAEAVHWKNQSLLLSEQNPSDHSPVLVEFKIL